MRTSTYQPANNLLFLTLILITSSLAFSAIEPVPTVVQVAGKQNSGIITKEVTLKNTGNTDVKVLAAVASCGCMVSSVDKKLFKPGESGLLTVSVDSSKTVGSQVKKVMISTDDPVKPLIELPVRVTIEEIVQVSNKRVLWARGEQLVPKSVEVRVELKSKLNIVGVSSSVDEIFPKLKASMEDKELYYVELLPSKNKRSVSATIRLETDSVEMPYVYFNAQIEK